MRHPFWILNSALLFLLLIAIGFIFFYHQSVPSREDIETTPAHRTIKKTVATVNIKDIYENDLFGTRSAWSEPEPQKIEITLPAPPAPTTIIIPEEPKPQFLDPLAVTLKGIMTFALDEARNRAIIADNKTTLEKMYKVGDLVEDAQLLRIYSHKILFIRSNGQQEVLYLREKDAINDPAYASILGWNNVITQINQTKHIIDPDLFVSRINNLAQFIDMLDITTVYKKGESFGCRIGNIEENSLGWALGLKKGDIILTVNDIPATTTASRFKIYKTIMAMQSGGTVEVKIQRSQTEILIDYMLQASKKDAREKAATTKERYEQEQQAIFAQKYSLAPTIQDIRAKERQYMKDKGQKLVAPLSKQD